MIWNTNYKVYHLIKFNAMWMSKTAKFHFSNWLGWGVKQIHLIEINLFVYSEVCAASLSHSHSPFERLKIHFVESVSNVVAINAQVTHRDDTIIASSEIFEHTIVGNWNYTVDSFVHSLVASSGTGNNIDWGQSGLISRCSILACTHIVHHWSKYTRQWFIVCSHFQVNGINCFRLNDWFRVGFLLQMQINKIKILCLN